MEMNDFMTMKALENGGLSPYEQYKVGHMQAKSHTSGIGVAGVKTDKETVMENHHIAVLVMKPDDLAIGRRAS